MENFIINRKQINLEKNKEFAFKIPVLINPSECVFQIEVSENDLNEESSIVFKLRNTKSGTQNQKEQISVNLTDKITITVLENLNLNGECLLLGCISNKNINFALSIRKNSTRFV
ncbi:MAG: hypothetical protein Q8T03_05825 [Bacteroidota bacterium]|nr:hypothetical protein [Bacteroidota bacterium]MDP3556873.1 hypothetical protein [Bacteroidota bacterium]